MLSASTQLSDQNLPRGRESQVDYLPTGLVRRARIDRLFCGHKMAFRESACSMSSYSDLSVISAAIEERHASLFLSSAILSAALHALDYCRSSSTHH